MRSSVKLILFLTIFFPLNAEAFLSYHLLQYVVIVIRYYVQQNPGQFKCVFYDISDGTDNGWMGMLLSSPQLDGVNKYVYDERVELDYGKNILKPSLTVIYVGDRDLQPSKCPLLVRLFFALLDTNSPLIILLDTENFNVYQSIGSMLAIGQFEKITFIGTKLRRVIQMGMFGMAERVLGNFPHPKDLIRSNLRSKYGKPIGLTYAFHPWYPAQVWAFETAVFLNSSLQYYPKVCTETMVRSDCSHRLFSAGYIDIALDHRDSSEYSPVYHHMIFGVIPISLVILVPQGRPFNAIEMFTRPFAWETWVMLLLMLAFIEVISLVFPALFRNDPILLLVCGFEKYNLHHSSAKEKATLLPLIIFFFVMFNAYGTKLISFITDKPSVGNIKTLDELARSNIRILADLNIDGRLVNDSALGPLMVHKSVISNNLLLEGKYAQLSNSLEASWLVSLMRNYDFELNRPKYVIINERKSTCIVAYWIGMKSPYAEAFYYTQKVFFEAGMFDKWQDELMVMVAARDRTNYRGDHKYHSGMLMFDDLISTWVLFTIGLLLSLVAFLMEFLLKCVNRKHYTS